MDQELMESTPWLIARTLVQAERGESSSSSNQRFAGASGHQGGGTSCSSSTFGQGDRSGSYSAEDPASQH